MKNTLLSALAMILVLFDFFVPAASKEKPSVVILATGGTIAGIGTSVSGGQYRPGEVPVEDLLKAVPQIHEIAQIHGEQVCQVSSQDMNNGLWLKLAKRVATLLASDDVDGIVITHGTDTLEETAYFLNLVIRSRKPVIMTAAMRAATSMSADGPLNLYNAVAAASNPETTGMGVMVVINDTIHAARDVTKSHTTNVSTFVSGEMGVLGYVYYGDVHFYRQSTRRHTFRSEFHIGELGDLPRVDILFGHANDSRTCVDAAVEAGAKGLVYAGVGNGNLYAETLKALIDARKNNVWVVRSSRVGSGRVTPHAEVDDEKYGFVVADNLSPQKSRILLMLALTRTGNQGDIQRIFFDY
jgi:L-asparaginase